MLYKDYEITAERNSWTQFEVIDEGELGNVIGTDFDDGITYGFRSTEEQILSDYSYSSLDEVKDAIDAYELGKKSARQMLEGTA